MPLPLLRKFILFQFILALLAAPALAAPIRKQERSRETEEALALRKKPELNVVIAPYHSGWTPLDLCDPRLAQWVEESFRLGPVSSCRQEDIKLDSFGGWGKLTFLTVGPEDRPSERILLSRGAEYRIADELKGPLKELDANFDLQLRRLFVRSRKGSETVPAEGALLSIMRASKRLAVYDEESALCLRYDLVPPVVGNLRYCVGEGEVSGRARLSRDIGVYAFEVKQVQRYIEKSGLDVNLDEALVAPKWKNPSGWYYAFLVRDRSQNGNARRLGIRAYRSGRTEHFVLPAPATGEPESSLFDLF